MSHILAIDIGTSSVRAALCDLRGNILPASLVKNERILESTADGGAEIDAEDAFRQIVGVIDDVLEKTKNIDGEIEYVAACAFWHSLMGIDRRGAPTTKVFGWADTRSRNFVRILRDNFDESATHNRTGARFHSSFWTAKLAWLAAERPKIFRQTAKWLSFSDYAALRLFDRAATSVSMASGTGIFDVRQCVWDKKLIEFLKIEPEKLPEICAADSQVFRLNAAYSRRWKKLKNAGWFAGVADGAANNIGAGCAQRSKAALMVGTSGALRVVYEGEPPEKIPAGLWCYRVDRKRVILGGALSDGGGLYAWLKDNLKLENDADQIESEISKRAPDAHGLTFLPFLAGERSTGYNEAAQGAILGLKSTTDPIDITQAALESVAYLFAEIFEQLNEIVKIRRVVASGGALRQSPVWTQIIADVLGRNLFLPDVHEASLRGAVLLALETIGKIKSIAELDAPAEREFRFDKNRNLIYREARARHAKFYNLLVATGAEIQ